MKPEAQRIAIGSICGLTRESLGPDWDKLPDYLNDLNAMHRAVRQCGRMGLTRCDRFGELLMEITTRDFNQKSANRENPYLAEMYAWYATAAQRAEALLKTFNLWTDHER